MKKTVIFIHGGGEGGYEADTKLADSLRKELGANYEVHNPQIHFNDALPDYGWLKQIEERISLTSESLILVGHSFGASMLLKYLSENRIQKKIEGLFLIAPPFWSGNEDWVQPLKLWEGFSDKLPEGLPIFFYQCKDDDEIPFDHFMRYKENIRWGVFREMAEGGHQLNNDLSLVAKDIRSL